MLNKYLNWYKWIISIFLLILCIWGVFYPYPVLLLSDAKNNTSLILPVHNQNGFTYEYTHSVHKTKVEEHFVFALDNKIVLTSTSFQSLGVGIPFLPGEGKLVNENACFVLTDINREFDFINIGFMQIADQSIILHDKTYRLEDCFLEGSFVKITYENMSLLKIIWQKWIAGKKVLYE